MKLSEEEIIKEVESAIWFMKEDNYNVNTFVKAIQGLLDLYKEKNKQIQVEIEGRNILVGLNENLKEELKKEKEKNQELKVLIEQNLKYSHNLEKDLFENCSNYVVGKDKIRKKIKEYDGLKEMDMQAYEEQVKPLKELLEEE